METLDRSANDTGLLRSLSGQPLPCLSLIGRPAACPKNTAVHMHKYYVVCILCALLLTRLWPFYDLVAAYNVISNTTAPAVQPVEFVVPFSFFLAEEESSRRALPLPQRRGG